jgi:hypothetical protein
LSAVGFLGFSLAAPPPQKHTQLLANCVSPK